MSIASQISHRACHSDFNRRTTISIHAGSRCGPNLRYSLSGAAAWRPNQDRLVARMHRHSVLASQVRFWMGRRKRTGCVGAWPVVTKSSARAGGAFRPGSRQSTCGRTGADALAKVAEATTTRWDGGLRIVLATTHLETRRAPTTRRCQRPAKRR